jgi:hypothetical protein
MSNRWADKAILGKCCRRHCSVLSGRGYGRGEGGHKRSGPGRSRKNIYNVWKQALDAHAGEAWYVCPSVISEGRGLPTPGRVAMHEKIAFQQ